MSEMRAHNATFYAFKGWSLSRKFYTSGRGHISSTVFDGTGEYLQKILDHNQGKWPGLNGPGNDYFRFVVIDADIEHGWPLMFDPISGAVYNESSKKD